MTDCWKFHAAAQFLFPWRIPGALAYLAQEHKTATAYSSNLDIIRFTGLSDKALNIGLYLLDFFCSGIQFNLLLSPYLCFISFLYLDLYVLGDDALIS